MRLGGKERLEQTTPNILGQSGPVVAHLDLDFVVTGRSTDLDSWIDARCRGLERVQHEVQYDLLELYGITDDRRQVRIQ